jgi:hypothetical protein
LELNQLRFADETNKQPECSFLLTTQDANYFLVFLRKGL